MNPRHVQGISQKFSVSNQKENSEVHVRYRYHYLTGPENFVRGRGPGFFSLFFFVVNKVFHRVAYKPPSRSNWTPWSICFSRGGGLYQYFLGNL